MLQPALFREAGEPSGHVAHDDRGNAIWTWREDVLHQEPLRYAPGFEISDETAPAHPLPDNHGHYTRVAGKGGYNPYESGLVKDGSTSRKRDLRALSKWIEERRQRGEPTKV